MRFIKRLHDDEEKGMKVERYSAHKTYLKNIIFMITALESCE